MEKIQQLLVEQFCEARLLRDKEYKELWDRFAPVQDHLIQYMLENGLTAVALIDGGTLYLREWVKNGVLVKFIRWEKPASK